jgi:hypothetical protein
MSRNTLSSAMTLMDPGSEAVVAEDPSIELRHVSYDYRGIRQAICGIRTVETHLPGTDNVVSRLFLPNAGREPLE